MANDIPDFDEEDTFEEAPDWLFDDDADLAIEDDSDEFDQLRRKSALSGSLEDEESVDENSPAESSGSSFSWSSFTPGQRVVLALLVVLDVFAILFLVMVFANVI